MPSQTAQTLNRRSWIRLFWSPGKNAAFLPVSEAFAGLEVITNETSGSLLTGLDHWRQEIEADSLQSPFDADLPELLRKQPPSKANHRDIQNNPSLWTSWHFLIALPALRLVLEEYRRDKKTRAIPLSAEQAARYFDPFSHIVKHYREHREFVQRHGQPTTRRWYEILRGVFQGVSGHTPFAEIRQKMEQDLPSYLRQKALALLDTNEDSLVGRIVLAYLATQGVALRDLNFDPRTNEYLGSIGGTPDGAPGRTLYARLCDVQQALPELDEYLKDYDPEKGIRLGPLLGMVKWYGHQNKVEMILPGLAGAAESIAAGVLDLFTELIKR